jgi:hypothetical protein
MSRLARWPACAVAIGLAFAAVACSDPATESGGLSSWEEADAEPAPAAAAEPRPTQRPAQVRLREPQGNQPPRIRKLSLQQAEDDESIWIAVVEADDAEGDTIELDYVWYVNGEPSETRSQRFDATDQGRGDRFHVEVTPRDRHGTGSVAASGRVEVANSPPIITSQPPASMADGVYRYMVEARDAEGDRPLRFELVQSPDGMHLDPYSGELKWRPTAGQAGTHTVEIAVSDNHGGRSTQLFELPIRSPGA